MKLFEMFLFQLNQTCSSIHPQGWVPVETRVLRENPNATLP